MMTSGQTYLRLGLLVCVIAATGLFASVTTMGAPKCMGKASTINDHVGVITGTNGNDVIVGGGGANTINGKGGNDVICGGGGNDVINAGAGNDQVQGGPGEDTINGGTGADNLKGGPGNDDINGGGHNDILAGEEGVDSLNGNTGTNWCTGGGVQTILLPC